MDLNNIKNDLLSSFFKQKETINGNEILTYCDEKQVNMFILFLLMKEWKREVENMKSPYFDFTNNEVKDALKAYMNTVSKHIKINKSDFEPLLGKALDYTIQLAENPESFMVSNHLESDLTELNKYIQYHKPYFDGDKDYEIENLSNQVLEKLGVQPQNEEIVEEKVEEKVAIEKPVEVESDNTQSTINESLKNEEGSRIIDSFTSEVEEETIQIKNIESIKNAITINQKFIFVNELFNGNADDYSSKINELDACENFENANVIFDEIAKNAHKKESLEQLNLLIKQKYNFTAE